MSRRLYPFERSIPHHADPRKMRTAALTVDELEAGLRVLQQDDTDREEFWAANGPAFRETVRLAIRETSETLLIHEMPATLRAELEGQLAWLQDYLDPKPRTVN